uniref:Uncharacterized protein n=1 Tax=uncultured bacterium contig00024 TaxID=1181513 RepID=A0A806JYM1_9BACT|nr:hypothetical protein [uncultured bacterium contig00024]
MEAVLCKIYCCATCTSGKRIDAYRRLGFRKTPFGLSPSAVFCSSTFFCARKNAPHFSLSGAKKRRLPFTLGDSPNLVEKLHKM